MHRTGPITIAHDYFTQRGGAERVAAALIHALEPSRVVTALHSPATTFDVQSPTVETSFLQNLPGLRADPRMALPALPAAWRLVKPVPDGIVICSSSGWSHSIRVGRRAQKIVYCHNPARWLYQPDDYFKGQSRMLRTAMRAIRPLLVRWDRRAARTADVYVANSTAVARRVKEVYKREAIVIHPPVSIAVDGEQSSVESVQSGFFLTVGRGRGYKNVELLVRAFAKVPSARLLVVGVPMAGQIPENVHFVPNASDSELRWLYANCRALISVSHEDFGLTPLEANAFGAPALVLRAGGFLDSLDEGVSGQFIDEATDDCIAACVATFPERWDSEAIKRHALRFSMEEFLLQFDRVLSGLQSRHPADNVRVVAA